MFLSRLDIPYYCRDNSPPLAYDAYVLIGWVAIIEHPPMLIFDVLVVISLDNGAQTRSRRGVCWQSLRLEGRSGVDSSDRDGSKL